MNELPVLTFSSMGTLKALSLPWMELLLEEDGSYEIIIDVTTSLIARNLVQNSIDRRLPKELITIMGPPTLYLERSEVVN